MNREQAAGLRTLSDTSTGAVVKTDLRVRKTYAALVAAFEQLTARYGYDEISVSALCNEALVRRSTFYKHFAGKDEFLLHYFRVMQREFEHRASLRGDEPLESCLPRMNAELLGFLEDRKALVAGFLHSSQAGMLVQALADHIAGNLRRHLDAAAEAGDAAGALDGTKADTLANFIAGGIVRVIQYEWLPSDGVRRQQVEAALYATEIALLRNAQLA